MPDPRLSQSSAPSDRCTLLLLCFCLLTGCGSEKPAAPPKSVPAAPAAASSALSPVEARARLVAAVNTSPDNPNAYLKLAQFDRDNNNLPDAEATFQTLRQKFPRFFEGTYQLGLLYLNTSRNEEAIAPLKAAVELKRDHVEAHTMLGLAYFRLGRYPDALKAAQEANRLNPNEAAPYLLMARIYSNKGTAEQVTNAVQAYLKRSNTPAPGYYFLARLYYRRADKPKALDYIRRAVRLDPENPDYIAMQGRIYGELGTPAEQAEGRQYLEQALTRKPDDWEIHEALGRLLMREQMFEEAIGHFRAALKTAPNMGPILYTLGQALQRAGHTEEGQRVLTEYQAYREYTQGLESRKRAVQSAPQDRSRHYALVEFCLKYRQYEAATAFLADAERKFGADAASRQLKARLQAPR
jgi:tetratricopeptide (TPR) repeat protein